MPLAPAAGFRERIRVLLAADRIVRWRQGDCQTLRVAAPTGTGRPDWAAAVATLATALAADGETASAASPAPDAALQHTPDESAGNEASAALTRLASLPSAPARWLKHWQAPRLEIVVAEHFARWLVLPWQAEISTPAESEAFARHRLREIYGEAARGWSIVCAERPPGEGTPVCAIDSALIEALHALARARGYALECVHPLFGAAADHWRAALPRGLVGFAVAEGDVLQLGLLHDRRWHAIQRASLAADDDPGAALAGLFVRTALAAGFAADFGSESTQGTTPGAAQRGTTQAAPRLFVCGNAAARCMAAFPAERCRLLGSALPWLAGVAGVTGLSAASPTPRQRSAGEVV
ncbi:hypothetical protein GH865_06865 [Rhodocyclus tenuis]|uniref:Uncharacterized protein n=1 Tax=Rhodocyclus tenuis TaxID=1066 RepID=A0A6L5JWK4_RHOTE|nr:hypothetical protein [Rhodocyclus gracilis]MQY50994.1 hypothetical protein [Rhodocyclus gracilis]MRD72973.1 hypothetical protein [Rhodocyclus gracilis]